MDVNNNLSILYISLIVIILAALSLVFYIGFRWIQYYRAVCTTGMKKVNFLLFLFRYPICISPEHEKNALRAFLRGFQPIPVRVREMRTLIPVPGSNVAINTINTINNSPLLATLAKNAVISTSNITDEVQLPTQSTSSKQEVFHIANQDFTYEQARCKCASYGAKLATYNQMVDSYNNGADWCSYGWTEGQRAYYPTQKCSWDKLQIGTEELRDACGEPGLNGGFFEDGTMKFGSTCYGVKPSGRVANIKPATETCQTNTNVCEREENADVSVRKQTDNIAAFDKKRWNSPS